MCVERCDSLCAVGAAGRGKAGGLLCLWVQLQYSDGSKTNGVVASAPLVQSEAGRAMLKAYVATDKGAKVAKYVTFCREKYVYEVGDTIQTERQRDEKIAFNHE